MSIRGRAAPDGRGRTVLVIMAAALALTFIALTGVALAGTETGEFCPTCPDWTNLDGWYSQKQSYDQAEMDRHVNPVQSAQPAVSTPTPVQAEQKYSDSEIITDARGGLQGMVVLDVRRPDEYVSGHIPGARNIYWKDTLSGDSLDGAKMKAALDGAGINASDHIAICGPTDDYGGAYTFWALSYMGHENLSVIDGGIAAASAAGIPPTTNAPEPQASNYTSSKAVWFLVNESSLPAVISGEGIRILDARDFSEYGRSKLKNAIQLDASNLYEESRIKDAKALDEIFSRRSIDRNQTQIVYGTPDAYALFYALRLMGYKAALIDGDWWKETQWASGSIS